MSAVDWVNGDPVELRKTYAADRAALLETCPKDARVEIEGRGGLDGLRFSPAADTPKAPILYFHGGGWMVGSPETHQALCAWLAKLTERRVISVRYPLAPEHRHPAQRDAARTALAALLDVEQRPVFLAGDSAGGAMALWAASDERDHVLGVSAFYPAFGLLASESISTFGPESAALSAEAIAAMYRRLGAAPEQIQADVPKSGAPVLILAAGKDPLLNDSRAMAAALVARGVTAWTAHDEEHAFLHHAGTVATTRDWVCKVGSWMDDLERDQERQS